MKINWIEIYTEILEKNREQAAKHGWKQTPEFLTVNSMLKDKDKQFLNLVKNVGSDKAKSLIATIEDKIDNRYFKITDKMSFCIISDILEKMSIEEIIQAYA